ncbi:MAG TPA: hypothetical protein P5089_01085 [Candidatus Portnoybacteria bacterium]|nr:hypothetical protein [Candidatus Portnoybacteria bacterium]
MELLKTYVFTWQQVGVLKLALLAIGVAIGAFWSDFFGGYLVWLILIGVAAGSYVLWTSFRQ